MAYRLRVSKPGHDVTTLDERNLVLDSDYNSPKIYTSGSLDLSVSATPEKTIVTHNFNYHPAWLVYIGTPSNPGKMYSWQRVVDSGSGLTSGWWDVRSYTTRLAAMFDLSYTAAGTYPCSYIVFADESKSTATARSYTDTYGLKISRPTKDASSTDLKDFSFHSGYPPLSIVSTVTLQTTSGNQTVSAAHGLGFRPAFTGVMHNESSGIFYVLPYYIYGAATYEVYVDSTHVYARTYSIATNTINYKISLYNHEI